MQEQVVDSTSHVGIFWFFKGEIIQYSTPYTEGDDYGDFVNGKSGHYKYWPTVQRLMPKTAMYEYDQVPRGRVVYSKRNESFYVYSSEKFIKNPKQKAIVQLKFKLPPDKTIFKTDEHYSDIPGMLED